MSGRGLREGGLLTICSSRVGAYSKGRLIRGGNSRGASRGEKFEDLQKVIWCNVTLTVPGYFEKYKMSSSEKSCAIQNCIT